MNKSELKKILLKLTEEELEFKEGKKVDLNSFENRDVEYMQEGEVYVFVEKGLSNAPVAIPGYEKTAKNYDFLNIVVNKHNYWRRNRQNYAISFCIFYKQFFC